MTTKRAVDFVCAGLGAVALLPLFALVALAIRLDDGGPVFFRQQRVGRRGEPFRIWKFRTMTVGAERLGPQLTVRADPRVTRVGRWLRRYKIDELPQLWNVLAGEMALVGPRPEVARYVERYTPDQRRVLECVPGITDPASLLFRDEASLLAASDDPERLYLERVMPEKLRLQLAYMEHATVATDIGIVLRTISRLAVAPRPRLETTSALSPTPPSGAAP
ncbi:MAG TPA: sugar transferase [Gemmatimonadales bacterium]